MDAKVCINQWCAVMIHLLLLIKWAYELMHIKQLMHKSASMDCVHYWFALYDL